MSIELPTLLKRFFVDWLMNQKKVSQHTIRSYRDTFQLLLRYLEGRLKKKPFRLMLTDLNADLICEFLTHLIKTRKISARSRNLRLSAIKSFFNYVSFQEPARAEFIGRILAIPASKFIRKQVHFLTAEESDALLNSPDLKTWVGRRDYAMILLAMEIGLRLTELINLTWNDVYMTGRGGGYIQCEGKGRKERTTPLSSSTAKVLRHWRAEMTTVSSAFIFPNKKGGCMSADCFEKQLEKYRVQSSQKCKSLMDKKITPHVLRHTAAINFLQAGVDISTIALILGHESIETTQIYLEADMQRKEEALKKLAPKNVKIKRFKVDDRLVKYLKNL